MKLRSPLCLILVLGLIGCGAKVKTEVQSSVEAGEVKSYSAVSPSENHRLKVELTSDQPVTLVVYMTKDIKVLDPESVANLKNPVGKAEKTKSVDLEVTIPSKEDFTVGIVGISGKANFSLKMISQ